MKKIVAAPMSAPRNVAEPLLLKSAAATARRPPATSRSPSTIMPGTLLGRCVGEKHVEEPDGALLVQRVVLVAALGRLHARRAAVGARARPDGLAGGRQPRGRGSEPARADA